MKELMSPENAKRVAKQVKDQEWLRCDSYKKLCDLLIVVIQRNSTALDDWLNIMHPEECNEERVKEARQRVFKEGTAAYIADLQAANRAALATAAQIGVKPNV